MTVKLSKILASTFLCVSTFSATFAEPGMALQDTAPANATLEALLRQPGKPIAVRTARPLIQPVTYTDNGLPQQEGSSGLQPLLPQVPAPPKFKPSPLLPSIGNGGPISVLTPSPDSGIIQPAPGRDTIAQPSPQSIPVVNGALQPQPIVTGPLKKTPIQGSTITYPSLPTQTVPTVPIVDGRVQRNTPVPMTASKPTTDPAPSGLIQPPVPAPIINEPIQQAPIVQAPIVQESITPAPIVQAPTPGRSESPATITSSPLVKTTPVATPDIAEDRAIATAPDNRQPIIETQPAPISAPAIAPSPSEIVTSGPSAQPRREPTVEQAIVAAQSEITGDEIKVDEVSTEELMSMILGPGAIKAKSAAAPLPGNTKERLQAIGSGTQLSGDLPTMEIAHPQEVFAGNVDPYMTAPCDTGYGCDAERPDMPSCLPYDGCGCVSGATGYAFVDFLYMDRDKGDFSASFFPANDSYTYTPGARVRIGRKYDSIEGWEAGFTMLDAHTANTQIISPTGSLSALLLPTGGFNLGSLSSFNGATFHESFQKSHFYSAELNRMSYNWDVMSSFIGLRYTGIDDLYGLNTVGGGGSFGTYRLRARNHLIGPQIGGELFYDVGRRLSFSVSGKLGGYISFHQTNTEFGNNNLLIVDNTDEDIDFAWSTEMGVFARYMLTPRAKLKVGYEFWYFDNVASAQGQYNGTISPYSGLNASNSDNALYHGASFGLEWYR